MRFRHPANKEVSVMAWIENGYGELLMVRQAKGDRRWALPGGKVKRFESLTTALKREIKEETGLKVLSMEPVDYYDRYASGNLTVLYRTKVARPKNGLKIPKTVEILEGEFKDTLPANCTPSARYFWKRARRV
jgi:ADP-ribose pyrophosphatase YjhB (NUDIX family)